MRAKTIIYILDYNINEINGGQHLQLSIIEDLLKNDFNIILIQKSLGDNKVPDLLQPYNNLFIENITIPSHSKKSLIKRGLNLIKYYRKVARTIKTKNYDSIYLNSSVFSFYLVNKIRKNSDKPIVYHVQDLYPDSLKTTLSNKANFIIPYLEKKQNKLFHSVDKIITISEDIRFILSKRGISLDKLHFIPNWFWNMERIDSKNNKFLKKFKITNDKFIIQYAGNFGRVLDYDFIINLAKKIEPHNDIAFHFIGAGSKEVEFKKMVEDNNLKNILFYPMQPFELVKDINSYADICFIPLKEDVIFHSVPSKASIAHALGIPTLIISNEDSKYADKINKNRVGMVVDNKELKKAYKFILELRDNNIVFKDFSNNSVSYANKFLTREINTMKIVDVLSNI